MLPQNLPEHLINRIRLDGFCQILVHAGGAGGDLLVEVIALALLAVGVSSHFGLADGARITVAYLVAYLVPRIILTRARGTSTAAILILLIIAAALMYIDDLRLVGWTRFDG